ncbi:MAG: hypothetical protein ACM3SR_11375 [Ignavibacteriales bacterium]
MRIFRGILLLAFGLSGFILHNTGYAHEVEFFYSAVAYGFALGKGILDVFIRKE